MLRRLFCLFSAFAVLSFCSAPVFATAVMPGGSGSGIGIPVIGNINLDVVDLWEYIDESFDETLHGFANFAWHLIDEDVCPNAPTVGGGHNFLARRTMVDGQVGKYYVCEYCGRAYGDMLEEAYEEYVQELPFSVANSDGSFIWAPTIRDIPAKTGFTLYCGATTGVNSPSFSSGTISPLDDERSFYVHWRSASPISTTLGCSEIRFVAPVSGFYSRVSGPLFSAVFLSGSESYSRKMYFSDSSLVMCDVGETLYSSSVSESIPKPDSFSGYFYLPSFSVAPSFSSFDITADSDTDYGRSTRPSGPDESSGAGFYGYVEEGQLYQSTVRDIFNETNNTYNNPVTGDTSNVENWTYDYSDRSYTLTTEEGDTVTVTYGDNNVTINEGGDTYNVYYLVEHEDIPEHNYVSSVTLAPTCTGTGVRTYTCTDCGDTYTETIPATGHSYQSAATMPPTCTNTGVRTFTCSVCGDSYTVSIAATGHTWQVLQTVSTEFDESGQLLREGYTIYQCSTCGEQYRITADTGGASLPSPSSDGTSTGNTDLVELDSSVGKGFLVTIAHGLTEDLPEVLKLVSQWFKEIPGLYEGYTKFLKASFEWMPEDCVKLMTFSVGMVVTLAICKAMFRR